MKYKKYLWVVLIAIIAFFIGKYTNPTKTVTKIKTVVKTKVVESVKKDVVITEKKDGSRVTTIKYRKYTFKKSASKKESIRSVTVKKPKYSLGVGGLTSLTHVQGTVRVFSNIHVGGYVSENTGKYTYGMLLRIEF